MIELIDFGKDYGDFTAVERLNLKINAGEMFGFIGPNGAGKSTSIRFLATLLKASRGEGIVNGHSVTQEPMMVRQSVGYMPDNFGVYDGMKVWEFLDFFAVAYRIPRAQRKKIIKDVLELLDLGHKRDDFVNGLSRGMKQRLCLAKTLVHDPPVLILDEPTSGLDPRARIEVKALLKELRRMGKTILISSHILTELADCCTSIGIIERGQLLMHGPISEVYRRIRRNRIVEIKFTTNMDAGLSIVRSDPHLRDLQVEDHSCTAELETDDNGVQQLLHQLIGGGVGVRSFADKEPSLEDVFMLVTKGLVAKKRMASGKRELPVSLDRLSLRTLIQLALQTRLERRPVAIGVHIVANQLAQAENLGIEIVEIVQRYRFQRHGQLRRTKFVFAMVANDHVLQAQLEFARELLAAQLFGFANLVVENADGDHHMADQLAFVAIAQIALVDQFVDLAHVVQKSAHQQQVAVDVFVARRDDRAKFHQANDVIEQAAAVGMMILDACRGVAEPRHEVFVDQKGFRQFAQTNIPHPAQKLLQSTRQAIDVSGC